MGSRRAIVTGSDGFIGRHLVASLRRDGFEVFTLDRQSGDDLVSRMPDLPPVDFVFHLAATNGTKNFYSSPGQVLKNNALLTFVFDKYLADNPDIPFVFASTCEVFNGAVDRFGWPVPTDETVPVVFSDIGNPRWSYSLPKAMAENYYLNNYKNARIIRYFNVFGEYQEEHFISEFVIRYAKTGEATIFGNDTRSFCYVQDAVNMTIKIASGPGGLFNVGREQEISIEAVAKKIMSILGKEQDKLTILPSPRGSAARRCPDMRKFYELFGRYDHCDFDVALRRTVEWILSSQDGVTL